MAEEEISEVLNVDEIFQVIQDRKDINLVIEYLKEFDCPEEIWDRMGYLLYCCMRDDKLPLMSDLLTLEKMPINECIIHTKEWGPMPPLVYSIFMKKTEFARQLIKAGADVNISDVHGGVLLHCNLDLEEARLLLENGASATINNYTIHGCTPLQCSAYNNDTINNYDTDGRTPLHRAVELRLHENVHLLLSYGADTDTVCNRGNSPFMTSLINQDTAMQAILLEYECDFNRMSDDGYLLELAIQNHSPFVSDIINRGADIKTGNVFQWCLNIGNLEYFKDFWQKKAFMTEYYYFDILHAVTEWIEYLPYLEYIIKSYELQEAIHHRPSSCDLISQLLHFTEAGYSRQLAQEAAYILMSYGVSLTGLDLKYIYTKYRTREYEMDDFFRLVLFMDINQNAIYDDDIILSLIFCTSKSVKFCMDGISDELFDDYQMEIEEIMRYVMHPTRSHRALLQTKEGNAPLDENVTTKLNNSFPSLFELARNQIRHYIHSKFEIKNACQFYTILERLPLPQSFIEIIEFRKSLY